MRTLFACFLTALSTCWLTPAATGAEDEPKFTDEQLEYFEKHVRPLFVKRCFQCHGPEAKRIEGGLVITGRKSLLEGGDTDASIVPGKPDESLLIDSINYGDTYQMPPKGKLPAEEIAIFTKWVEMGAPWPEGETGVDPREKFDLEKRRKEFWAWQPITDPAAPKVKNEAWPRDPLDRFVLAKVEEAGLTISGPAEPLAILRRMHFDIIGLPPTLKEIADFELRIAELKKTADSEEDAVQTALAEATDKLLASSHFGERWGRHWLDLMRYAESRGHEFDYNAANSWEYRDYVIRALNADVPYDQFLTEHIAGDLLSDPRRHPDEGFNESVIATGFWHLGEWVHSPVDIRHDETERQDNMIDVFGKTFLGMTVACARCHDHKFDAISQADYYAMAGYLQSSAYRLARYDTLEHNREIARQLHKLRKETRTEVGKLTALAQAGVMPRLDDYLLAARDAIITSVDPEVQASTPKPPARRDSEPVVFADFESGAYDGWTIEGGGFGDKPVAGTLPRQQAVSGFQGKHLVNTYVGGDGQQGKATSRPFEIKHRFINMLIGGGAHTGQTCVNLVVDGKIVRTMTGKNNERLDPAAWNVQDLLGKQAHLEIVDAHSGGWGHINLDQIEFSNTKGAAVARRVAAAARLQLPPAHVEAVAKKHGVDAERLKAWVAHLGAAKDDPADPMHLWARIAHSKDADEMAGLQAVAKPILEAMAARAKAAEATSEGVVIDYRTTRPEDFLQDGVSFGIEASRVGELALSGDPAKPLAGVSRYAAAKRDPAFHGLKIKPGWSDDHGAIGYNRAGRTLRTPTFTLGDSGVVHYLVVGAGHALAVVDSHRLVQGPLHKNVHMKWGADKSGKPRWVSHNLGRYKGHRFHIEFTPDGDQPLEVLMVTNDPRPPIPVATADALLAKRMVEPTQKSPEAVAKMYWVMMVVAAEGLLNDRLGEGDEGAEIAALADWVVRHESLFVSADNDSAKQRQEVMNGFLAKQKELTDQVRRESRVAMAMYDGDPVDELLLIRGSSENPGKPVPRGLLVALTGGQRQTPQAGSGRLDLAKKLTDPANPLTSRVMANRIWHHLMGRGIVASTDNFGVLGERPTHPELLDHLATRLAREGWSVKRMIKEIVLSKTYQMSSRPNPAAVDIDPANKLLHRARIRRLQGEAIRDAILSVSGRLDPKLFGRSVNVHLTAFMTGRGRPPGGPLDGAGRRSIYTAVRRNFLPPMMLAFDMPQPFNAIGRRTVSNVPAQALILMNDPLVIQQADLWAKRLLAMPDLTPEQRIDRMYQMAFARGPTDQETADALQFLNDQAKVHGIPADQANSHQTAWADLCHVMFNVKEFIFVP